MNMKLCGQTVLLETSDPSNWHSTGMGRSDIKKGQILISEGMSDTTADSVLIHEVVHFILDTYAIELPETGVNALSVSMHSWMIDNPKLIEDILNNGRRLLMKLKFDRNCRPTGCSPTALQYVAWRIE